MQDSLLEQGITLMLAGMGTVFVFLTVLVIAMTLMSTMILRFRPDPAADGSPTDEELAAISAAIEQHKREQ